MLPFLIKLKDAVLDILFPPICLNCQKHLENKNKLICENCLSLIKLNNTLFCPICRARLANNKLYCGHFITEQTNINNPRLSASNIRINPRKSASKFTYLLAAAGNYDDPVLQNLIHYFKYKYFQNLAPILSEILIKHLSNLSLSMVKSQKSIVVPIPLHSRRERERGFNQAKLLSEIIADHFNLPLIDGLKRIKNNEPQVKFKGFEKRIKNVSGCFAVNPHTNFGVGVKNPIKGKNIILIDDVFTSGATMNEAVKILKQSGAKRIIALVIAKA